MPETHRRKAVFFGIEPADPDGRFNASLGSALETERLRNAKPRLQATALPEFEFSDGGHKFLATNLLYEFDRKLLSADLFRVRENAHPYLMSGTNKPGALPVEDDEDLGEPSVVVIDLEASKVAMMHNHQGPGHPALNRFLENLAWADLVTTESLVRDDAFSRFKKAGVIRTIDASFNLTEGQVAALAKASVLSDVIRKAKKLGTQRISIRFSMGRVRKKGLERNEAIQTVESLYQAFQDHKGEEASLRADVKATEDEETVALDLLRCRLLANLDVPMVGRQLDLVEVRRQLKAQLIQIRTNPLPA